MRFLLRSFICLGVLYAVILRHDGYLVDPARFAATALTAPAHVGETIAASAGPRIAGRLEAFCRTDPAACLSDAMALAKPSEAAQSAPSRRGRVSLGGVAP